MTTRQRDELPGYYAIIPANVRYDKRLPSKAPLLYGEITALANKSGSCWAGDDYFCRLYGVSRSTVQAWMQALEQCGYIERSVTLKPGSKEIDKRYITLSSVGVYRKTGQGYTEKSDKGIPKNRTENNTSINNTRKNIKPLSGSDEPDYTTDTTVIVDYLNNKASSHYKASSAKTKRLVHARIKDGFSVDDFKHVINTKTAEWLNTDMEKFIRPETLFGTKFESYLNQKVAKPKSVVYQDSDTYSSRKGDDPSW